MKNNYSEFLSRYIPILLLTTKIPSLSLVPFDSKKTAHILIESLFFLIKSTKKIFEFFFLLKWNSYIKNLFVFFLLFLFLQKPLLADFEEFLKPANNKGNQHKIKGIDFIYMINLDQRPEKFAKSFDQLQLFGITPYRFSAVNGWDLPMDKISKIGILFQPWMKHGIMGTTYGGKDGLEIKHEQMIYGKHYFVHCMSRGAIGISLSHLSILKDAIDSGYEVIWVMEDDVHVVQDPNLLTYYIKELDGLVGKNGWDILFTDPDTKGRDGKRVPCLSYAPRPNFTPKNPGRFAKRKRISNNFTKIGARYGAYSMIIKRSGAIKLFNFIKQYRVFEPWDMEFTQPDSIKLFSLNFDVVSTLPHALSDNGSPNYKLK